MEDKDVVLSVDRGQGRESNIEISREEIWVHSGKGVTVVDVWITPLDGSESLRVHIVPQDSGLAVVVDRGDKDPQWWRQGAEPRLAVTIDREGGVVTTTAWTDLADLHNLGSVPL